MLDINLFRIERGGNPDLIRASQKARGASVEIVDEIIVLDKKYLRTLYEFEQTKKQINILQKEIGQKIKNKEDCNDLIAKKKELDTFLKSNIVNEINKELQEKLSLVGNIVHDSVIINMDEKFNEVVRIYGTPKTPNFKLKSHFEVMQALDMIDTERGCAVAGHRGYFLKDYGVLLNQALINYGLIFLRKKGYTLLQPPYYMFKDIIAETVQLSDYEENLYKMVATSTACNKNTEENDKYLIATSEQPISAYHRHEVLTDNQLPLLYCGLSTCFRKEAGAHGKDVQGIFRVHQFEKVEQFCITKPEDSWLMFEKMISITEEFYQSLGLHYQIVNIVSGALNNAAAKKYDLEAWFPESQRFRELVSCSNCTDYQSISMDIRLKRIGNNKNREFVHCLNSTLSATERTMCCLVENYQTETGLVIPEVLRPYLGTDFIPYKK
ncbi:serine-tRNA synthetase [Tupanvirus soda lake]|uniref:serine--tRNA ligase n=2 Tax=Tupanvirus TaxID=2094720 RepID=A0A6N1NU33_9VIRU|nr:serine-tRNA synthetase [Tupanvirus soda lake]QKU35076.1 serine-tRNA synthetase [Tupanvirus soda lake]